MAANEERETEKNPYAYLDRDGFTSEKYKIEVRGLPKYYGIGEFKKFLNEKLDLQSCKVKPPKRSSEWLYVSFRSEEGRQKAIETLNGFLWKNCKLSAQVFLCSVILASTAWTILNARCALFLRDRLRNRRQIRL